MRRMTITFSTKGASIAPKGIIPVRFYEKLKLLALSPIKEFCFYRLIQRI
jgi:hypothetical protein